jgi:hypothetical protein
MSVMPSGPAQNDIHRLFSGDGGGDRTGFGNRDGEGKQGGTTTADEKL